MEKNPNKCAISICKKVPGKICCSFCSVENCPDACKNKHTICGQLRVNEYITKVQDNKKKKAYNDPTADLAIGRVEKRGRKKKNKEV